MRQSCVVRILLTRAEGVETRAENHQDVLRAAGAARVTRWAARDAALIPLFEKAHCRLDLWPRQPSKACVRAPHLYTLHTKINER